MVAKEGKLGNVGDNLKGLNMLFGKKGFVSGILPQMPLFGRKNFHPKKHDTSSSVKITGNTPFLKQLLKKISAKLEAIMARKPYSSNAQGACSRLEPQPKF